MSGRGRGGRFGGGRSPGGRGGRGGFGRYVNLLDHARVIFIYRIVLFAVISYRKYFASILNSVDNQTQSHIRFSIQFS